jgi:tRNA (guanine-N7-)-methyltransferase
VTILGLEIRLKYATPVDARLKKDGLHHRARVLGEDAKAALPRLRPDGVVSRVYLHFPDPWWKKRHEKRLVMGGSILDEVARLLLPGGELFVQTDVEERAELYQGQIDEHSAFAPAGDASGSPRIADHGFVARTNREYRAIEDGLPVYRMLYRRKPAGDTVVAR